MKNKQVYLKLIKGPGTWILIGLLFSIILLFVGIYSIDAQHSNLNSLEVSLSRDTYIDEYNSLAELKEQKAQLEKDLEKAKIPKKVTLPDGTVYEEETPQWVIEQAARQIKVLGYLEENYIPWDSFYHQTRFSANNERHDFLLMSRYAIFLIMIIFSIFITYRVFGQEFAQQKSFFLVYNNKKRMRSYFSKMKFIAIANFVFFNIIAILVGLLSLTYKQAGTNVLHEFNNSLYVLPFAEYMFLHFYMFSLLRVVLLFLIVNTMFTFILRPVISLLSSLLVSALIFFIPIGVREVKEVFEFAVGASKTGMGNTGLTIIKVVILMSLAIIYLSSVLHFRKRDLS